MVSVEQVWVTLRGERFHVRQDCQGIADGHAKAEREHKLTYEPEPWPPRLASSGQPDGLVRRPCQRCCADWATGPGNDDPEAVARAKQGSIFKIRLTAARQRAKVSAVPFPDLPSTPEEGRTGAGDDQAGQVGSSAWDDEVLEAVATMYLPVDADDGESFYN